VDVAGALKARGYQADGEISFTISDDALTPWNDGGYRLTVSSGNADVQRTAASSDLTLSVKALASAWCGRHRLSQLANWGLVHGDADAITRADNLLATQHSPHCPDHF
jgi:predicted acetyltransferase